MDYVREDLHFAELSITCHQYCEYMPLVVEEIPRQGRLEGCHRMSAATHLICELESV